MKLLRAESSAVVETDDVIGETFRAQRGAKQGSPLSL